MNKCNKTKTSSQIQTEWWLPEGRGRRVKCVKGIKFILMDGNQTFGGKHIIEHIGTEL